MGHQVDIAVFLLGMKIGDVPLVQGLQYILPAAAVPDAVEQVQEAAVALAVDLPELHGAEFGFAEGSAGKEIRGVVVRFKHFPLLVLHYRRELLQVPDHQQLHTAERLAAVPETPQNTVHRVQQVGAHHAYLVYHQQVHAPDDVLLLAAETEIPCRLSSAAGSKRCIRNIWCERQLEKRVQRHTARIDGRNPRRRQHHHTLRALVPQPFQKSRLARPRLTGQKHMNPRPLNQLPRQSQLSVLFHSLSVLKLGW